VTFFEAPAGNRISVRPDEVSRGPNATAGEAFSAAFNEVRATDLSVSRGRNVKRAIVERREAIERITGKDYDEAVAPYLPPRRVGEAVTPEQLLKGTNDAVDALRRDLGDKGAAILPSSMLARRGEELALEKVEASAAVEGRTRSTGASAAALAGGMAGYLTDPVILLSMAFGGGSGSALRAVGTEMAIAAGSEAAIQPAVQAYRADLGLPSGFGQAATNVAVATAGAGLFTGAVRAGGKAAPKAIEASRVGARALARQLRLLGREGEARTAETLGEKAVLDGIDNPYEDTPAGRSAHRENMAAARAALESGEALTTPPAPMRADIIPDGIAGLPAPKPGEPVAGILSFDPDELIVDAQRFQFKDGGDDAGVTDRLAGVEEWDPLRAGVALVWEDESGARFIVDGHQRRGLASRIKATGAEAPQLPGYLLREGDGISAEGARAIAATKNIAEGTGTAIDAAKVLRDAPEIGVSLPPRSALVRDARGLAALSDDAFGMVVNKVVDPAHAALAGRLAGGSPDLHPEILAVVARHKPASLVEAESIIRDVIDAPAVRETQSSLFGEQEVNQPLYAERAKVIAAAERQLRKDRQAFGTLVREENRLTEEGNVLAGDRNRQRAEEDAKAIEKIQRLARRKGPIADALAEAANQVRAGKRPGDAAASFIDTIRKAPDELEPGGNAGRGAGADREAGGGKSGSRPEPAGPGTGRPERLAQGRAPAASAEATEHVERIFDDPDVQAIDTEARRLEVELEREIRTDGNFELPDLFDGDARTAQSILDEAAAEKEFLFQLEVCGKAG